MLIHFVKHIAIEHDVIRYILSALILLILSTIIISWRRYHRSPHKKSILNPQPTTQKETNHREASTNLTPITAKSSSSGVATTEVNFKSIRSSSPSPINTTPPANMVHDDELYISIPLATSATAKQIIRSPEETKEASEILSIIIESAKTKTFEGYSLLQTILATDLHYGEQCLFHKYKDANCTTILFSLAAGKEKKGFDLKDMRSLNCSELILSMDTKATSEPKEVYNFMLAVAKQLSNNLGGKIIAQNMQGKL